MIARYSARRPNTLRLAQLFGLSTEYDAHFFWTLNRS